MHDGYKVGPYWNKIPGFEIRAPCTICGTDETMEHILTECSAPGQSQIWNLASTLWEGKKTDWTPPSFANVLACGLTQIKDEKGMTLRGESRLYRIIVSESAYLIWKLRNERVINDRAPTAPAEIQNRWIATINHCLSQDCLLTNPKYGSKTIKESKVKETSQGTLWDEENLSSDWNRKSRVLVGIRPCIVRQGMG